MGSSAPPEISVGASGKLILRPTSPEPVGSLPVEWPEVSLTAAEAARYRLDDLRRLAASLASGLGVEPARASAMVSHLLWFDAAGASTHGIATLPRWLDRLDRKEIDPVAEGRVRLEHAGTAVFDARNGLAPLALEKAGEIASEKARDVGIGIVRVENLGPSGPPAPIIAGLAVGPFVAAIAGPGASLGLAMPMAEGLPAVYDSELDRASESPSSEWLGAWSPWVSALSGGDGWVILALAVSAMEPLTGFHDRVASSFRTSTEGPGRLLPDRWEARRREVREQGVSLDEATTATLRGWADRLGVAWPSPVVG